MVLLQQHRHLCTPVMAVPLHTEIATNKCSTGTLVMSNEEIAYLCSSQLVLPKCSIMCREKESCIVANMQCIMLFVLVGSDFVSELQPPVDLLFCSSPRRYTSMGKSKNWGGGGPIPVPFCPSQILHGLTWAWIQACALRGRWQQSEPCHGHAARYNHVCTSENK
jgi:hypothetical protein